MLFAMTVLGNSKIPQSRRGIFIEIASVALLPRNDGDFRNDGILNGILNEILGSSRRMTQPNLKHERNNDRILNGILNEIASSFVSLTPRNDRISVMTEF